MDARLRSACDALFDPQQTVWAFERPAPGAEPGPGEVFLSVGSRDAHLAPHPLMLGWKLPQWRSRGLSSTTQVVLDAAATIDALPHRLTLRAHEPTLDVLCAALLLSYRRLNRQWPAGANALCEYVTAWEQGRTELAGQYEGALASAFYAGLQLYRPAGGHPARELVTLLSEVLDRNLSLLELAQLPPGLIAPAVQRRLRADSDLYRTELSRGQRVQLELPLDEQAGSAVRRVDALFLSSPQDVTVLKLLARPDQQHSFYRRGFEVMAIHAPNEAHAYGRHTITLAPESPGSLANLGVVLDRLEGPIAPDGTARVTGKPRFTSQPAELQGLADPWYCDAYPAQGARATLVAPPFAGTRLTREEIWEALWDRFNLGRNIHVTSARTVFARPFRMVRRQSVEALSAQGWKRSALPDAGTGLLPSVFSSFLGDAEPGDVAHLEKPATGGLLHLSVYPSDLVLAWFERTSGPTTLFELAQVQARLAQSADLHGAVVLSELDGWLAPVGAQRWSVFGAYRINRARSTMLDDSRSVLGLFHALASGAPPTLESLPSELAVQARKVIAVGDDEHWLTSSGGARFELRLEDRPAAPALDEDFTLFLLTLGQRYTAFEITRRMGEVERRSRTSRWASLLPSRDVRADVMFFTNSLWYARVSDDPDLEARYDAWKALHGMAETVESLRSQTTELDEFRKERFEGMVGLLVFVFLPITIVCGFFSGAQFNEMDLKLGLPWTTGGWKIFLIYTGVFTVLVFGTLVVGRLLSFRRR
ncbi:MAG: hypothetical protein K1X89_02885 [Myxococcaceae bacterium]|nr:hypothetical protein [Myxococcaceae bacterium]